MAVPDDIEDRLNELTPEQLDDVARLAERLAEDRRRQQRIEEKEDENEATATDVRGDPLPAGVPAKASLTKRRSTITTTGTGNGGRAIVSSQSTKDRLGTTNPEAAA